LRRYVDPIRESHQPRGHTLSLGNDWSLELNAGWRRVPGLLALIQRSVTRSALTKWSGLTGLVGDDRGEHGMTRPANRTARYLLLPYDC
jgi:hypothetical protein